MRLSLSLSNPRMVANPEVSSLSEGEFSVQIIRNPNPFFTPVAKILPLSSQIRVPSWLILEDQDRKGLIPIGCYHTRGRGKVQVPWGMFSHTPLCDLTNFYYFFAGKPLWCVRKHHPWHLYLYWNKQGGKCLCEEQKKERLPVVSFLGIRRSE